MTPAAATKFADTQAYSPSSESDFIVSATERDLDGRSTGSPARDQQLRLERDVFHSMSARMHRAPSHNRGGQMLLISAVAVAVWAAIFSVPVLMSLPA